MSDTPELPPSDDRLVLADQHEDEANWLAERRKRLTASDLYTWVAVDKPSWWSSSREDILAEKLSGAQRMFGSTSAKHEEAMRKMAWGRVLEEPYVHAFGKATGIAVAPLHALLGHKRWPGLAATLDAVARLPEAFPLEFDPSLFSNPCQVEDALEAVCHMGGTGIIEVKSTAEWSFKKTWLNRVPEYYEFQPRLQMAIAEVDWCLIICGCGQDMTAHAIVRDADFDDFEALMDDVSDEFALAIRGAA